MGSAVGNTEVNIDDVITKGKSVQGTFGIEGGSVISSSGSVSYTETKSTSTGGNQHQTSSTDLDLRLVPISGPEIWHYLTPFTSARTGINQPIPASYGKQRRAHEGWR